MCNIFAPLGFGEVAVKPHSHSYVRHMPVHISYLDPLMEMTLLTECLTDTVF
jgi:hypothetical protein